MKNDRCTKCNKPLPASAKDSVCGYCRMQRELTLKNALAAAATSAVVLLALGLRVAKSIVRR